LSKTNSIQYHYFVCLNEEQFERIVALLNIFAIFMNTLVNKICFVAYFVSLESPFATNGRNIFLYHFILLPFLTKAISCLLCDSLMLKRF